MPQLLINEKPELNKNSAYTESFDETDMAEMLAHHYGDGSVYLTVEDNALQPLFKTALKENLISEEGYLTRKGRRFMASYQD